MTMPAHTGLSKTRKSYSCVPCRRKKIKCSRTFPCDHCTRKELECAWPENGVPEYVGVSERASPVSYVVVSPGIPLPRATSTPLVTSEVLDAGSGPYVSTVAQGEQLDHSILGSEARTGRRKRGFPFPREGSTNLLANLPSQRKSTRCTSLTSDESDRLLRTYLERVEWIHHPLHIPTFLTQYNAFYAMDDDDRSGWHHLPWLAVLYVVLCLGAHFGDENEMDLEEALLRGCEDCLAAYDFMNQPTLETVQTIICLNLYLNNRDQVSTARALLAMVIRLAQALNMHRIAEETKDSDLGSVVERELARRLWWSLVCQDAYTASNGGMTYSVNLAHATTLPFANLDDEELVNGRPRPVSRDVEELTVSTYHLAKVRFALVVRDFIDAINARFPDVAYSQILSLDARFRQVFATLPKGLRPDLPQPFDPQLASSKRYLMEQRVFMGITLHNRLLRLHRAYMSRGYNDTRYTYSTKASLSSAYDLLGLVRQCRVVLCKWWVVIVHVWTSGLVLSVDMLRGEQEPVAKAKRKSGVELAISLLEPAARTSPVAARGVTVLRQLLAQADGSAEDLTRAVSPGTTHEETVIGDIATTDSTLALLESLFPADFTDWSVQDDPFSGFFGTIDNTSIF